MPGKMWFQKRPGNFFTNKCTAISSRNYDVDYVSEISVLVRGNGGIALLQKRKMFFSC